MKNKFKKVLTGMLVFSMMFSILSMNMKSSEVSAQGLDYDGYTLIESPIELDVLLRNNPSAKFRLKNNIDLTGYVSKTNSVSYGWTPITKFTGTFDGAGYTISGLWSASNCNNIGLFGIAYNAKIKNLTLELDCRGMRGCSYVGGIAGIANNYTTIENSKVFGGPIVAQSNFAGAVVGQLTCSSNIRNVCVGADVSAYGYAGGAVGLVDGTSSLYMVGANGNVNASTYYAGGLIGMAKYASVSNCYATGDVSACNVTGGLVGYFACSSVVESSYSSGRVVSGNYNDAKNNGAFVGYSDVTYVGANFYDISRNGVVTRATGNYGIKGNAAAYPQGKDTATMMKRSNYSYWDFTTIWRINEGTSYPYFDICNRKSNVTITFDKNSTAATGTMENQAVQKNTATPLDLNAFSRYDYKFLGWATTPNGNVVYTDGQQITTDQNITLYAVWGTPDLYHSVTISPTEVSVGDVFTVSNVVGNRNTSKSSTVYDAYLYLYLPAESEYVNNSLTVKINGVQVAVPTRYDSVSKTITITLGELKPGQECVATYSATVLPAGAGKQLYASMNLVGNATQTVGFNSGSGNSNTINIMVQSNALNVKASNDTQQIAGGGIAIGGGGSITIGGGSTITIK